MRKASERERENRNQLFKLMQEHPELPIIPMVDSEIVCDDTCAYWEGSWGKAEINAYIMGDMHVYFREDDADDMEEVLNETVGGRDWYTDATDDEIVTAYNNLPWTDCIVVYIAPRLTEPEIAIMRAVGARWVSRDDNCDDGSVDLWGAKPLYGDGMYSNTEDGGLIATIRSSALFPSVNPGDCIGMEDAE